MDKKTRKIFRKAFLTCVLCFASVSTLFAQGSQNIDGVAAIVNDRVITFSEVKRQVEPIEKQIREFTTGLEQMEKIKEARLTTLKSLIERELIIQDFDKAGFFFPDNLIEERLNEVIKDEYGGDRNALIRTLHANGTSLTSFKDRLREQMIVAAMRARNVRQAVIVSPFKIEQYYQENIRQFTQPKQVKLRILFLRNSLFKEKRVNERGEVEQIDPQLNIVRELHHKLETGSDFPNLARNYSEGAQRNRGGDWGWVTESTLRPELAKVAFSLRPGEFSEIISTEDGYYILMVEDVKRPSVLPLADVREQIETTLMQEERARLQQEWLDRLRSRAFIKMF